MEWMIVVRYVEEARSLEAKRRLGSGGWGTLEVCDGLGGDRGVWGLGYGVTFWLFWSGVKARLCVFFFGFFLSEWIGSSCEEVGNQVIFDR